MWHLPEASGAQQYPPYTHKEIMDDIPQQIDFGHYMAVGMVWYGAKYSHGVWERFAHTFDKSLFDKKTCVSGILYVFTYVFGSFTFLYVFDEVLRSK